MAGLIAEKRMNMLKGLVRTLPQASLRSLEMALGLTNEAKMVEVRELIAAEMAFRQVRETVFAPFMPLFRARADGLAGVRFEPWIVNALWSAQASPICAPRRKRPCEPCARKTRRRWSFSGW